MPKTTTKKGVVGDEANFRQLLLSYKRAAKKRGHAFEITSARFRELTKANCYLCGKPPTRGYKHSYKQPYFKTPYVYNGVDRFENALGYVEGNVITCCGTCNKAKGTHSVEEFLLYVYDIYKHTLEPSIKEGIPDEAE